MKFFTGIGSEDAPKSVLESMGKISTFLNKKGFILRSGHAKGSDWSFEQPLLPLIKQKKKVAEIYLAWNNFGREEDGIEKAWHDGINYFTFTNLPQDIQDKAEKLAAGVHTHWEKCGKWAKLLLSRDSCQLLGQDLKTPSDFVVCWTPEGMDVGGSAIVIRLAKKRKIPVYNLGAKNGLEKFKKFAKTL